MVPGVLQGLKVRQDFQDPEATKEHLVKGENGVRRIIRRTRLMQFDFNKVITACAFV